MSSQASRWGLLLALLMGLACEPESEIEPKPPESNPELPAVLPTDAGPSTTVPPVFDAAVVVSSLDAGLAPVDSDDAGVWVANDAGLIAHPHTADAGGDEPIVSDSGVGDSGVEDDGCPDELVVMPLTPYVTAWGMVTFEVQNGIGPFRFELSSSPQYGAVNRVLGRYAAGGVTGVADVVQVVDEGCDLSVERTVHIVEPVTIQPNELWLPPNVSVEILVSGGSGDYIFEMIFETAGGSVDSITGVYTAPFWDDPQNPPFGLDQILVRDLRGNFSAVLDVIIDVNAELEPLSPVVLIPLGSHYDLSLLGGSGRYGVTFDQEGISYENGTIFGQAVGSYVAGILDLNTGLSTNMQVDVVQGQQANLGQLGDRQFDNRLLSAGDVNDDGFEDVLLGRWDHDVNHRDDGAVYLFHGNAHGFDSEPFQTWHGDKRFAYFGRQMALGQLIGDERLDLVVGASRDYLDEDKERQGAVYVYEGIAGGFSQSPGKVYWGDKSDDRLGYSVAVCDFNGDGYDDLAAGGINIENEEDANTQSNQGGIQLYAGSETGLAAQPTQILWGQRLSDVDDPTAAVWEAAQNLYMGRFLKSGDLDNDGHCDLVSSNYGAKTANGRNSDGIVKVFKGQSDNPNQLLSAAPVWAIAAFGTHDPGKEFGRMLELADLNQDGFKDFIVSHHRLNIPNTSGNNHGALKVFFGQGLGEAAATSYVASDAADLTIAGAESWGYTGFHSAVTDVNGDGVSDLVFSEMRGARGDFIGTGWHARGQVGVYLGPVTQEGLSAPPDVVLKGTSWDDYFGAQILAVNLQEGLMGVPGVVSYAPDHHGEEGQCVGLLQFVPLSRSVLNAEVADAPLDAGMGQVVSLDGGTPDPSEETIPCSLSIAPENEYLFTGELGALVLEVNDASMGFPQTSGDGGSMAGPVAQLGWRITSGQSDSDTLSYFEPVPYNFSEGRFDLMYQYDQPGVYAATIRVRTHAELPWSYCLFSSGAHTSQTATQIQVRQKMKTPVYTGTNEFGSSVAFLPDFFGDDAPALAVGAPANGYTALERYKGSVFLYAYEDGEWSSTETTHIANFKHHRDWDKLGRRVKPAGDFDGDGYGDLLVTLEDGEARGLDTSEGLVFDENCEVASGSNHGVAYVFGGASKARWEDDTDTIREPLFGVYGLQKSQRISEIAGDFDYNGDGYDDFIFSGFWDSDNNEPDNHCSGNNCGGYALIKGRPFTAAPGETQIICSPEWVQWGLDANSYMGRALAGVGDIDGDGCDEFAVSATHEDLPLNDQGLIRVVFGWGENCDTATPYQVVLGAEQAYRYIGFDLDGQHDIDGDGLPDLAVGAPYFRGDDNVQSGAGLVVYGRWLSFLRAFAEPVTTARPATVHPLGEPGFAPHQTFLGVREDAFVGHGVTLIPGASGFSRAALAVGWRRGEIGNSYRSGGAMIYRSQAGALLSPTPYWAFTGESGNEDSALGWEMDGFQINEKSYFAICGKYGRSSGMDRGSCYVIEIK